jgi:uncharacterized protein (DUF885 family)
LLAALALAVALRAVPARAADHSPRAQLRAVTTRYEAHLLLARPDLASRAGRESADDRLEPVTEATLERDAGELAAIAQALAAIDPAGLGAHERATLDTLRERTGREAAALRAGLWRTDPDSYLVLARDAPLDAATRPHVSACERARRAAARLRVVPELLRAAEVNLREASGFDRAAAVAHWRAAMMDLRVVLPQRFDACPDGGRYAAFVEADTLALGAMDRFARFLAGESGLLHDLGPSR